MQMSFFCLKEETLRDFEAGHLYGLEKFWAYLHYSKNSIDVNPKLSEPLKKYKTLGNFRANVSAIICLKY